MTVWTTVSLEEEEQQPIKRQTWRLEQPVWAGAHALGRHMLLCAALGAPVQKETTAGSMEERITHSDHTM
ncbi:unnamed protein product, partial [Clonostachys rhizophaga]